LHRFAVFVAVWTGLLVFAGGLVTSNDSGLSVPDWPLSYGTVFPPMVGNVRFEHGHRMVATFVGMLTIVLAIWLQKREARPSVRRLGWLALAAVVAQGLLGGLTVLLLLPTTISVAHACLGQTFFCLVVSIALVTSPGWRRMTRTSIAGVQPLRNLALVTTALVFVQLVIGAWMRHSGAGLAIPDFPLAFGGILPPFGVPGVAIHFAHRAVGTLVAVAALILAAFALRRFRMHAVIARPALLLGVLVVVQVLLGGITVWSRQAVIPTTLHVLGGAIILATSLVLAIRTWRTAIGATSAAAPATIRPLRPAMQGGAR
jgi:cytochrome c oxidase assembly protein subunit 15